jgi:hypothetical protein
MLLRGDGIVTGPRSGPRRAFFVLALLALATACVAPARTFDDYEGKAVTSAETAASEARTAILTSSVAGRSQLPPPTASVIVAEAAVGATGVADTFASIQPPDAESDALRAELLPALEQAADLIASMRIAARRTDTEAMAAVSADLAPVAALLERFVEEHR